MENIEKKTVGAEMTSEDGLFIWREIYEDGTNGNWERTGVETNNGQGMLRIKEELKRKYGQVN